MNFESYPLDDVLVSQDLDGEKYYYRGEPCDRLPTNNLHYPRLFQRETIEQALIKHCDLAHAEYLKATIDLVNDDDVTNETKKQLIKYLKKQFRPSFVKTITGLFLAISVGILVGWAVWG